MVMQNKDPKIAQLERERDALDDAILQIETENQTSVSEGTYHINRPILEMLIRERDSIRDRINRRVLLNSGESPLFGRKFSVNGGSR